MNLTRDSKFLYLSTAGAVLVGMSTHLNLFPWLPPNLKETIEGIALIYGIVAAQLSTSPLKGKND